MYTSKAILEKELIVTNWIEKNLNRIGLFEALSLEEFYIAGASCRPYEKINDFDLFPVYSVEEFKEYSPFSSDNRINKTEYAATYMINGHRVQLCFNYHESLKELVDSFDFTHISLGAHVIYDQKLRKYVVNRVYLSKGYIESCITGHSDYKKNAVDYHPVDSLIRVFKYYDRLPGLINPSIIVPQILNEIMTRYNEKMKEEIEKEEPNINNIGEKERNVIQS